MRIIATADLHYDILRSRAPTERIASAINAQPADALLIVGDACAHDLGILRQCLQLFDAFPGKVFYVAGNHDLWTYGDSLDRHERELAEVCEETGVWYLDARPYVRDGVALVGSVGWYDYSFRNPGLGIPDRFYEQKVGPGAAAYMEMHHLDTDAPDVSAVARSITTRWMDGVHVHLPMNDAQFTRRLRDRLADHLEAVAPEAEHIVVAMHHLPFEPMVRRTGRPNWDFANAFMGSRLFGELLLTMPKVRHVLCGHSHHPMRVRIGHIECVNIGSTYTAKRQEVLDVP